ncbi:hypothetical protein AYO47_03520 [Planctomyces sp. SCGC AG-212-M04]|nr:hypothetical protein AYO47_03520 [Planctomyces sp. SCGC AG-212-M04]
MTGKTTSVIGYLRVSTKRQGDSGLGIEGQRAAIEQFANHRGLCVLAYYTEIESGTVADRPALREALGRAKRQRATLAVAKLDRLARNVAFLSSLMEEHVEFIACDNPDVNRLTIHILAAVAEDEARRISDRTKAALQAYKSRGGVLGAARPECRNLTNEARKAGARKAGMSHRDRAVSWYAGLSETIGELRKMGLSYQAIANNLNEGGETTRRGGSWTKTQVMRVLKRDQ